MNKNTVKVYAYLVFRELRTIEQIPKAYQEAVKKELEAMKNGEF